MHRISATTTPATLLPKNEAVIFLDKHAFTNQRSGCNLGVNSEFLNVQRHQQQIVNSQENGQQLVRHQQQQPTRASIIHYVGNSQERNTPQQILDGQEQPTPP
ncbi:hypothetical protein HCN44_010514 [Aphidius gifuensis]|uniref:Uncharacterized protein n=1 Tax=Aphidius gifuensis TaxID=684658 RepID=A0A835CRY5_APHGI|nr:hypothetical protein HCN44_010514 [Aphidius gifuensis]